jgi:ATP-dependent Zn protease
MIAEVADPISEDMSREQTAYHEAGHAVVAWAVRRPFKRVTIVAAEDYLGMLLQERFSQTMAETIEFGTLTARYRERVEAGMMTALGGGVAATKFCGGDEKRGWRGTEQDIGIAGDYAMKGTGGENEVQPYMDWLLARTENLVNMNHIWVAVEAVAKALIEKQTLNQRQVRDIILDAQFARFHHSWTGTDDGPFGLNRKTYKGVR